MKRITVAITFFLLGTLFLGGKVCASQKGGVIVALEGKVTIVRRGGEISARLRDPVYPEDIIRTGPGARVKIFFEPTEVITTISEQSDVTISEYYFREESKLWKALFYLGNGRMRLDIEKTFGRDIAVRTPNAIAGTKGTSFVIEYDKSENNSILLVLSGKVRFESRAASVLVGPGHWSEVRAGRAPLAPAPAPAELKNRMTLSMRTQRAKSAAALLPGSQALLPAGERETQEYLRAEAERIDRLSSNPQDRAVSQSGAFIVPGSLAVAPSEQEPAPPAPEPPRPEPPKPKPAPVKPSGGAGGPF